MVSSWKLDEADHRRVSEAIARAEARSDGEIVTVVTDLSDRYHDVALHWAVSALIAVLALSAVFADSVTRFYDALFGQWGAAHGFGELLFFVTVLAVLAFLLVLLVLRHMPLRLALTPAATKQRRVRRRAIALFKAAAERRTVGRTGVLLYLSLGEHRAELVADEAIVKVTTPECWGDAMADLIGEMREGRPAEGLVLAVEDVGEVLSRHFPKTSADTNEIPDKLIEL